MRATSSTPGEHGRPGGHPAWDVACAIVVGGALVACLFAGRWETVPFHLAWLSLVLFYGARVWPVRPTVAVLVAVVAGCVGVDLLDNGPQRLEVLAEIPLMAALFVAVVWRSQRRVSALTEARRASERSTRLLEAQRQFVQDASHQLRTPVTIALGHAELLQRQPLAAEAAADLSVVVDELHRLGRLSERLLLLAAARDPGFLRPAPVELDTLVTDVVRRWSATTDRLWRAGPLDDAVVDGDVERLTLMLDALIENAVLHTRPGQAVEVGVLRRLDAALLLVLDEGDGISAEQLPYIFDRSFTTGTGSRRGTGLGLPIVRAVAEAHGGQVHASGTAGGGAQFRVWLPLSRTVDPGAGGLLVGAEPVVPSERRPALRRDRPALPVAAGLPVNAGLPVESLAPPR